MNRSCHRDEKFFCFSSPFLLDIALSYSRVSFFLFLEGGFAFYEFCKKEKREGIEQKHSKRANTIQSGSDLRRKAKRELEQSLRIRACVVASVLEGEGEGKERSDRSLCKYRSISRGVKGKENMEKIGEIEKIGEYGRGIAFLLRPLRIYFCGVRPPR